MYTEGELRKHLKRHKIREEGIKRKKYTCEYCGTEMNFTSRKRHLLKQHGIMLRGKLDYIILMLDYVIIKAYFKFKVAVKTPNEYL